MQSEQSTRRRHTYDSGTSAPWREAGYKGTRQIHRPVDEPARPLMQSSGHDEGDFVAAMDRSLWRGVDAHRREEPPRDEQKAAALHTISSRRRMVSSMPPAAKGLFDMAVALAIHAATQSPGPARGRNIMRCLDALERAVAAGHPGPGAGHRDFAVVSELPRFKRLVQRTARRGA